jgi:CelD/BcsL family acetyltransferase involved in cellulose biosynthesis
MARITVQVVNEVNGLRELSAEWERLWRETPEVSAFQALEWILAWAPQGGRSSPSCLAMVLRAGDEPLAIFPTQLSPRGALSFIGAEISNYCGPVYLPGELPSIVQVWRDAVSADPRIQSIDLPGLRERSPFLRVLAQSDFPRWGKPVVMEMSTCPEVDLRQGWNQVFHRHKSRQRANWRRKWDSLAKLGRLEFLQTSNPDELAAAFPRLLELYRARWDNKRIPGWSGAEQHRRQFEAAKALGGQRLVRLSQIRLEGEMIAFAYAMRGIAQSTSYVLAHDAGFDVFSPGLLLLIRTLEAAAAEGDTGYDFSLGDQAYKLIWGTGEQRVFRVLLGRGVRPAVMWGHWRSAARSIPLLRKLKQEGLRRWARWKAGSQSVADQPGLSAGSAEGWHVYRIQAAAHSPLEHRLRPLRYSEMRAWFSPRLLALALDRHYRGDQALAVEHQGGMIGAIWRAAPQRRSIVSGGYVFPMEPGPIYYHPVAPVGQDIEPIVLGVAAEESVLVCPRPLGDASVREIHTFGGDLWFRAGAGADDGRRGLEHHGGL